MDSRCFSLFIYLNFWWEYKKCLSILFNNTYNAFRWARSGMNWIFIVHPHFNWAINLESSRTFIMNMFIRPIRREGAQFDPGYSLPRILAGCNLILNFFTSHSLEIFLKKLFQFSFNSSMKQRSSSMKYSPAPTFDVIIAGRLFLRL